jgi:hypothetical protein
MFSPPMAAFPLPPGLTIDFDGEFESLPAGSEGGAAAGHTGRARRTPAADRHASGA